MEQVAGTGGGIDFKYIGNKILVCLVCTCLPHCSHMQGWIMANVSQDNLRLPKGDFREDQPYAFKILDGTNHGEVLSRVTNDVDTLNHTLNQSLTQIITSVTTIIGAFIMMLSISWLMTLVALITVPLSSIIAVLVVKHSQKYFMQQQVYLGHVNGHVREVRRTPCSKVSSERKALKFDSFNRQLYGSA